MKVEEVGSLSWCVPHSWKELAFCGGVTTISVNGIPVFSKQQPMETDKCTSEFLKVWLIL